MRLSHMRVELRFDESVAECSDAALAAIPVFALGAVSLESIPRRHPRVMSHHPDGYGVTLNVNVDELGELRELEAE